ncbi:hypothetical protein, partial [Lacticaseibacillus sp. 53-4]|uniref:hypothetical protein n=1 Tax=Lacticaseibacillus sp. 53-4 TaxID=2799575 RepID=UPI001940C84D
ITTDAWLNNLDHYQGFVITVALDLKIEDKEQDMPSDNPHTEVSSDSQHIQLSYNFDSRDTEKFMKELIQKHQIPREHDVTVVPYDKSDEVEMKYTSYTTVYEIPTKFQN